MVQVKVMTFENITGHKKIKDQLKNLIETGLLEEDNRLAETEQSVTEDFTIPRSTQISNPPEIYKMRKTGDVFCGEYLYNDEISLEDGLKNSYDLKELEDFFRYADWNEAMIMYSESSALFFSDVNEVFPVEFVRTRNYSVYKVNQGGYFYVFWAVSATDMDGVENPPVEFSAYIQGDKSEESFYSLRPNVSTAKDVMGIDSYFELRFEGTRTYSNSYINKEWILTVYYKSPDSSESSGEDYWDYEDFVIDEMLLNHRVWYPRAYAAILTNDLP